VHGTTAAAEELLLRWLPPPPLALHVRTLHMIWTQSLLEREKKGLRLAEREDIAHRDMFLASSSAHQGTGVDGRFWERSRARSISCSSLELNAAREDSQQVSRSRTDWFGVESGADSSEQSLRWCLTTADDDSTDLQARTWGIDLRVDVVNYLQLALLDYSSSSAAGYDFPKPSISSIPLMFFSLATTRLATLLWAST
jgi:hypothetical protein